MRNSVLIVEDQFLIAMAIEDAIVGLGYEVAGIAASRSQALDYLDEVDMALVDVNLLDGPSGIEIAREFSRRGATVVFMTANPESVAEGIDGVLGVISKPVQDVDLANVLKFAAARRAGANPSCPKNLKLFAH